LLLFLLLLAALLLNWAGQAVGVERLVWHDDSWSQFFVGVAFTLVILEVLYVGYLTWLRALGRQAPESQAAAPGYAAYAQGVVLSLVVSGLVVYLVHLGVQHGIQAAPPSSTPPPEIGTGGAALPPLEPPYFLIAGAFAFVLTLNWGWLHDTRPQLAWACWGTTLLGSIVLLVLAYWFRSKDVTWPLVVGAIVPIVVLQFTGPVLRWGTSRWGWAQRLRARAAAWLQTATQFVGRLVAWCSQRMPSRQVLSWLVSVVLLLYWLILLLGTWRSPLGGVAVVGGALVTVMVLLGELPGSPLAQRVPLRHLFVLTVIANGAALYVGLSWLSSRRDWYADWTCIFDGVWYLLGGVLAFGLIVLHAPRCFDDLRHSRGRMHQRTAAPAIVAVEHKARKCGMVGFVVLWALFLVLCGWGLTASPVVIALALLFFVAALYGLLAYFVPRWAPAVYSFLAILGALSAVNSYKFRFPECFDELYHQPQLDSHNLETLRKDDWEILRANEPVVEEYHQSLLRLVSLRNRIASFQSQLASSDLGEEQKATILEALKALQETEPEAAREEQELRPRAQRSFQALLKTRLISRNSLDPMTQKLLRASWPPEVWADYHLLEPEDIQFGTYQKRPPDRSDPVVVSSLVALADGREPLGALPAAHLLGMADSVLPPPPGPPSDEKSPLVLIAVSGGGLRAAVWTFLVLEQLETRFAEKGYDFPAHVRLITGASGGMLGAAYYVGGLTHPRDRKLRAQVLAEQRCHLEEGFLTPLMNELVFSDVPHFFSPWHASYDRGKAFEDAVARKLGPAITQSFADLQQGEREGWRPSLVFAPMMVEDGRRLIVSNLSLADALQNTVTLISGAPSDGKLDVQKAPLSWEGAELFRLFPEAWGRQLGSKPMKLVTAVRMSASFPVFSPVVSLPTTPRRRLVDAGYYDNYGISMSSAWLFTDRNMDWLRNHVGPICVIQVRDGVSEDQRALRQPIAEPSNLISRALEELTTPPEGLFNAREASSSFRNDGQLKLLAKFYNGNYAFDDALSVSRRGKLFVATFEYPSQAPLNWHLSTTVVSDMQEKARSNDLKNKVDAILSNLHPTK
jgi:hypothetical protein